MNSEKVVAFFRSRIGNAITHLALALIISSAATVMAVVVYVLLGEVALVLFAGWLSSTFYFLGRERRDHEIQAGFDPLINWYRQWNIWKWKQDTRDDFLAPAIGVALVGLLTLYFVVR